MAIRKQVIRAYIRANNRYEDALAGKVRGMLDQSIADILSELGRRPSEWRTQYLEELLARSREQLAKVQPKIQSAMDAGASHAIIQATGIVKATGAASVLLRGQVGVDPHLLRSLAAYRADLITGVTDAAKNQVTSIVRRSMLTGQNLLDVEKQIGSAVDAKGAFKSIGARAETIVRTEYRHVLGEAGQAGLREASEDVQGLKKEWLTAEDDRVRESHAEANGQVVGVDEPFIVGGEELMYPGDPAGSPENVCNCRCVSIPAVE